LRPEEHLGKPTLFDGKTGKPRTIIDIELAARLRVTEESRDGLRFRNLTPAGSPYTAETDAHGARVRVASA